MGSLVTVGTTVSLSLGADSGNLSRAGERWMFRAPARDELSLDTSSEDLYTNRLSGECEVRLGRTFCCPETRRQRRTTIVTNSYWR